MIILRLFAWLRSTPGRPRDADERRLQRLARVEQAIGRLGRDEQRKDRAGGDTYLVFPDRATADEVMREISATPILPGGLEWPVRIWDTATGRAIGTIEASDGRVAACHRWTEVERRWLAKYVKGWRRMEILDALPADWQFKKQVL